MFRWAIAALIAAAAFFPAAAHAADTVYVMRHLQKAAGDDPPLTEDGAILADLVASMFGGKEVGIKAVFATRTRRAQQTGEPLAKFVGVPVTLYDPRNVPALVEAVNATSGSVLIVGHSNTVPDLVAAFGGTKPPPLSENDYGTIYRISLASGKVREFFVPPPVIPHSPQERGR